jgi:sugar phosphate isomerase/epimerase
MTIKLGLIQGIIAEDLKRDYWPTVSALAALGYRALEVYSGPAGDNQKDTLKRLRDLGLTVIAHPASKDALEKDPDAVAAAAKAVDATYVMLYWLPSHESLQQLKRTAEFLERAGKKLAAHGLKFCYHNHDFEFKKPLDGKSQLDLLLENTSPGNVYVELDIGWATYAGADPAAFLARWAGRVPVVHVKDFVSTEPPPRFTAVGTGILQLRRCLEAVQRTEVDWAMVEQDKPNILTPMETVTACILNIRELGFLPPPR